MTRRYEHILRVVIAGHMDPAEIWEAREWCWAEGYRIVSEGHSHRRAPYRLVAEKQVGREGGEA